MKLLTPPWKTAWYDDGISERFFQEMSRLEKSTVKEMETSAQWLNQLMVELGQLAQHLGQLEQGQSKGTQITLAHERALKLTAVAAHLTAALDRADPERPHTPVGAQPGRLQQVMRREISNAHAGMEGPSPAPVSEGDSLTPLIPLRQTVTGLSRRGLSVAEIEVITGQSRTQIEAVLNKR